MGAVLVLNADYSELNVTSLKRAITLVVKGKAEVLKSDQIIYRSEKIDFHKPIIIRLLSYVSTKIRKFRISRNRIYRRDGNACGYCGATKNLTIDHIVPKSQGGKNEWTNLVTCCYSCNMKKANRTPEEAKMILMVKPYVPDLKFEHKYLKTAWEDFLMDFK